MAVVREEFFFFRTLVCLETALLSSGWLASYVGQSEVCLHQQLQFIFHTGCAVFCKGGEDDHPNFFFFQQQFKPK